MHLPLYSSNKNFNYILWEWIELMDEEKVLSVIFSKVIQKGQYCLEAGDRTHKFRNNKWLSLL